MIRAFLGAAVAVALVGSAVAYAADTAPAAPMAPAATTDTSTPPSTLKCKPPKVPTQVKSKGGKMVWKCKAPTPPPAAPH